MVFETYLPEMTRKPEFEEFWKRTLKELVSEKLALKLTPYEYPSDSIEIFSIQFTGLFGEVLNGWYLLPKNRQGKIPCMIDYLGYLSVVGEPIGHLHWASLGFATIVMDVRGQGGLTGDAHPYPIPLLPMPITHGLLDREVYYQRRLFADAFRCVEAAEALPEIDNKFISLTGASQGGALVMATAALGKERIFAAFPDVPSSSDIATRIQEETGSFKAIADYLRMNPENETAVLDVQTYFDTMNLAEWITCPIYASVALKDPVCPAKNYFASYNRIQSKKRITCYPYNGHEGGGQKHLLKKMRLAKQLVEESVEIKS